jgi:hypothetical protein
VDAAGKFGVLDFSGFDEPEPVRVRSVENDDVSMLLLPFKAGDHQPLELVPDLSAGTAGSAIPVAGSAPRPAATYRGGSILPAESIRRAAAELRAETEKLRQMLREGHKHTRQLIKAGQLALIRGRRSGGMRPECSGSRPRASRGRPVRRRGSRRGTPAPTRAGPEAGDPEPAGSGAPVGDTSRAAYALAGRLA